LVRQEGSIPAEGFRRWHLLGFVESAHGLCRRGACGRTGTTGLEPATTGSTIRQNISKSQQNGVFQKTRYTGATNDPDFVIVAAAWDTLPESIKARILGMVEGATAGGGKV